MFYISRVSFSQIVRGLSILWALQMPVYAGILTEATRVVYTQGKFDQSLMLANTNEYAVVLQTWVDHGEVDPDIVTPFVVIPAMMQLQPKERQGIRILLADPGALPQDRESVFWLNLHEVPPTRKTTAEASQNNFVMTMNTQLKIFYRPNKLPKQNLPKQLRFTLIEKDTKWYIQCENPTPYHASFITLSLVADDGTETPVQNDMDMMTVPFAQRTYLVGDKRPVGQILRYNLVDDDGSIQQFETSFSSK